MAPSKGASYREYALASPRELRIHVVEIDLDAAGAGFRVRAAPDPDGDGPANTELVNPLAIADRRGSLAMINANGFWTLPDDPDGAANKPLWYDGRPVKMMGWVVEDGVERQAFDTGCGVWSLEDGRVGIGGMGEKPAGAVRAAAGAFALIVDNGVAQPGDDTLHPRSGIGVDATGRRLWLAVVDGRRPGYSMGMTTTEWGAFFRDELGAYDAVNLDGGGSSALILACADGKRRVMNLPSDTPAALGMLRPVPVMISIE
ncbi:MAG: phosphodiester glycosidase family protein [Spirochaetaceae bacterium]|nr:phosphodiester glycosidase family protein [Spirochaetaceae bacterium]